MSVVCDAVPFSEPASGPQRSRTASVADAKAEKEKRKRSRVTPEQLVHLERFFAMDRSPTAARRKEISDMLGMQERQTQIWFQNRRAKAKLQDGKKGPGDSAETPPDTPPQLATGYEAELQNLLHEDEPITIIPCTDLSVGTWRRVATSHRQHDLVAYLCDTKRCLTWFIHSSGYGFKMEIPFDIIVETEFSNAAPGSGLATFILSRPPTFYFESFSPPDHGRSTQQPRYWKTCADWTEDLQATKVLRHHLVGSAVQLAHVLRHLNEYTRASDIQLHSPTYHSQNPSPVGLEVQPSPPTAIPGTGYHYHPQDGVNLHEADQSILARRRSFPSAISRQQLFLHDGPAHLPIAPNPTDVIPEFNPTTHFQYPRHPAVDVTQAATYPNYSANALTHNFSHSSLCASRGSYRGRSPHNLQQRPYSASSTQSLSCEDEGLPYPDSLQPSGSTPSTPYGTPSPPLLTTPFYPGGSAPNTCLSSPYDITIPVISAIPGLSNSHINP